jgi:DNA-binding MarR family transcriptional regulator
VAESPPAMTERSRLLDEIGALEIRLVARGLPEETASLLDYNITLQQLRAFALVFARGQTPINGVAHALGIKPNVATGIIQRLVDRGLIERREDPGDRRVRLLSLTQQGFALIDELSGIILAKRREFLERLSDQQLHQLRDILTTMGSTRDG